MRQWKRSVIALLLIIFLLPAFSYAEVSTRRDDKGVWHIEGNKGDSLYEVFKAMGYAVAEDRLWQMETFRRTANGSLSAIFGESQLQQDIFMRTIGYSDTELTEGYNSLNEETKAVIEGYVAGVNQQIADVRADLTQLPFEFHAIGQNLGMGGPLLPRDWTPEDVLAWQALLNRQFDPGALNQGQLDNAALFQYLQRFFLGKGFEMFNDLRWTNDPDAQTYIPATSKDTEKSKARGTKNLPAAAKSNAAVFNNSRQANPDLIPLAEKLRKRKQERKKALKEINAWVKMGSYAWVVSGDKTVSGRPILYSGPQMGFSVPAIVQEGSIEAAGLEISGMAIPGLPGIVIGRTPHHCWSMQVGHAHTTDYYFESPSDVYFHRQERIEIAGADEALALPVYRSDHGPIINPLPLDLSNYDSTSDSPIVAWRYSHWGEEFENLTAFLNLARARSLDEFGAALRNVSVSQHFCYADRKGNIAYWMSGMDPVRPDGFDYRFPQGMLGPQAEWADDVLKPLSSDKNTAQGFYGGWNNKSSADYPNSFNNMSYFFGPFHRAHVIEDYLENHNNLTFEQVRDLALNIATTDSIRNGGNPWAFVEDYFRTAVNTYPSAQRTAALALMEGFDGHFVAGGRDNWVDGMDRSDAWMLSDAWIREVLDLTFSDELLAAGPQNAEAIGVYDAENEKWEHPTILFNVILHSLDPDSAISNNYDWFDNFGTEPVETADQIIVDALDNVLSELGERPWGAGLRGEIKFNHNLLPQLKPLHTIPFASRSTYAHCVEMCPFGPIRIESMFPLGESGNILAGPAGGLQFDEHFYSMTPLFDHFVHRDFPIFIPRGHGIGHGPGYGANPGSGHGPGYGFGHGHGHEKGLGQGHQNGGKGKSN